MSSPHVPVFRPPVFWSTASWEQYFAKDVLADEISELVAILPCSASAIPKSRIVSDLKALMSTNSSVLIPGGIKAQTLPYSNFENKLFHTSLEVSSDGFGFTDSPPCHRLDLGDGWECLLVASPKPHPTLKNKRAGFLLLQKGILQDSPSGHAAARVFTEGSRGSGLPRVFISAECHFAQGEKWNPDRETPAQTIISKGKASSTYYIKGIRGRFPDNTLPTDELFALQPPYKSQEDFKSAPCKSVIYAFKNGHFREHSDYVPPSLPKPAPFSSRKSYSDRKSL